MQSKCAQNPLELDLIWGAAPIAKVIGRSVPDTYALLKRGHIPNARRVGKRWAVSRRSLATMFVA